MSVKPLVSGQFCNFHIRLKRVGDDSLDGTSTGDQDPMYHNSHWGVLVCRPEEVAISSSKEREPNAGLKKTDLLR